MLLILSCLTSCPGDSVESSTRLIHHVIRLMHALLILRASMRVRTHRDGNVHVESSQGTDFGILFFFASLAVPFALAERHREPMMPSMAPPRLTPPLPPSTLPSPPPSSLPRPVLPSATVATRRLQALMFDGLLLHSFCSATRPAEGASTHTARGLATSSMRQSHRLGHSWHQSADADHQRRQQQLQQQRWAQEDRPSATSWHFATGSYVGTGDPGL